MSEELRQLEFLLLIQGDSFEQTLEWMVIFNVFWFMVLTLPGGLHCVVTSNCSLFVSEMAKKTDLSPLDMLKIIFAYEKHTSQEVMVEEMESGVLGPKLQPKDLDVLSNVSFITVLTENTSAHP